MAIVHKTATAVSNATKQLERIRMLNPNNLMIDLETFGTHPGCVVCSLAAVPFFLPEQQGPAVVDRNWCLVTRVDIDEQLKAGFKVEANTVKWWMLETPEKARAALWGEGGYPINSRQDIYDWLVTHIPLNEDFLIWAKPSAFDFPILECLIQEYGRFPWHYRSLMCLRTQCRGKRAPDNIRNEWKQSLTAHDPYDDCLLQIRELSYSLGLGGHLTACVI